MKPYSNNPQSIIDSCFDTKLKEISSDLQESFGRICVKTIQSISLTSANIYRVTINSSARTDTE